MRLSTRHQIAEIRIECLSGDRTNGPLTRQNAVQGAIFDNGRLGADLRQVAHETIISNVACRLAHCYRQER